MNAIALIVQLLSGAAGGNLVGKLFKKLDLGTLGNSIAGILGGGIGGQILGALGLLGGATDLASILGSVASGGVGGGVLMAIVGVIKSATAKSSHRPSG